MSARVGKVIFTTSANHLKNFSERKDELVLQESGSLLSCKLNYDIQGNVVDYKSFRVQHNSPSEVLNSWYDGDGLFLVNSTEVDFLKEDKISKHKYQPAKSPVLGCCNFQDYVVTVTADHYTVCNLKDLTTHSNSINEIKKCTAIVAGWHKNIVVDKRSMRHIDVLFCDGNKVYHYVGDLVSIIDTGRVLSFCKTQFGYLAAFETNWRLSPMHLFSENPINLESLEIPRNHTSSNEARLQLYSYGMECVDDHALPGHNEPTLLVERANIVCVSGFYKHVISIFLIKNGTINHVKDLSVGLDSRCAGLAFRGNDNVLVLKRRFNNDNILLTFPSKTGRIEGDASIESIKLDAHIGNVLMSSNVKIETPMPMSDLFDKIIEQEKTKSESLGRSEPEKSAFTAHSITNEEIDQKAREILEDYRQNPRNLSEFSDSELSEGTLELLADCRTHHPFVPIPVSDSSDDEKSSDEHSQMLEPGKLILPLRDIINSNPMIKEVFDDLSSKRVKTKKSKHVGSVNIGIKQMENKSGKEQQCASQTENKQSTSSGIDAGKINDKLDRIIGLLEKQNSLLEIIAKK